MLKPDTDPGRGLPQLPLELMERVCETLATRDLAALRGSCRQVHHLTHHCFAQRYGEYHTDFSERSLRHLHALAQNPGVGRHIRSLVVLSPEPRLGKDLQALRWAAAGQLAGDSLTMPSLRTLRDDLVRRLPHCRSFVVSPIGGAGPPEHPQDPQDLQDHQQCTFNPDDVVSILWEIVADAALPVQRFWYGQGLNYSSSACSACSSPLLDIARLPKGLFRSPGFRAGWAALQNLHLEQTLTPHNYAFCLDLILHAPALRKLHLGLGHTPIAAEFVADLSRALTLAPHPPTWERLSLAGTTLHADDLLRLLHQSRARLQTLWLRDVSGLDASWLAALHRHRRQFPRLAALALRDIRSPSGLVRFGLPPGAAGFQLQPNEQGAVPAIGLGASDIIGMAYGGSEMDRALETLVQVWTECGGGTGGLA
ncbi:hypothetical protein BO70DRAFT_418793 [Aspergillus heteromorphus CBS 117.55]|uniref:F-box domain-containing protein n=1 Tax=Aspergillus heteromorphus CBS 117.55 TaxID=1448321 RepID=A0A317V0E9_9EURO|nr:uncharacterized protein BO70DRAFT_418793 [Aspergillus heteromorphus CBS 117.55]PWY67139.1 hypothetical protein BO70DRAFT_418793 [Aspergillus heteromorphus CBS 117.55]